MNISVIIPTWNRLSVLPRAINSVLSQTTSVHEIIVIDDGSTDGTAEQIRQNFPTVKLLQQSNAGVSKARNVGIDQSTGDWIALLDSDDEWLPTKLETQIASIRAVEQLDHDCRICHTDEIWIRNGVRVNPKHKHTKYGGWIYPHCLPLCAMSPSSVLLHKTLFDQYGLFDPDLPACEDYDLWLRLCAHQPVLFVDQLLLNKYGGHADQLSQKHWGMDRFRMVALAKAITSDTLNDEYLQMTKEQLAQKLEIFSKGALKRGRLLEITELERQYKPLIH